MGMKGNTAWINQIQISQSNRRPGILPVVCCAETNAETAKPKIVDVTVTLRGKKDQVPPKLKTTGRKDT